MASEKVSEVVVEGYDKYRSYIWGEGEKNTVWRFGAPPTYDIVNKLFEEGRTQEWAVGTLEEKVQRLLKSWEMEIFHKVRPQDFKTLNPETFTSSINGRPAAKLENVLGIGGYNAFLQTTLPVNLRAYDPSQETSESSQLVFRGTFPRGFAIEVLEVYSDAPVIVYKFRHWAYMEGPFKGHAPTGELVEFYGTAIFTLDESMKLEKVEIFYDPNVLLGQLLKGPLLDVGEASITSTTTSGCPFLRS
ncbi:hypothetical protein IFM89_001636 [Coptis chinensis]|uniref:Pathogen-related protein n=1 Tax=Coptis chinensis TaxID=261450 RepID=A0A835HFL3_9MAGN|nr:hypothetical protein IFM89_001636 [Coptis chinensis]